jgi:serpin B
MKRMLAYTLTAATLIAAGCSNNPVETVTPDAPFPTTKSQVERESTPASQEIVSTQAESNNEFTIKMYQQLSENGKNLFFSPYSITSALAMTAAGAANDTKKQMLTALQVQLDGIQFDQAINTIDQSLMTHSSTTDGITLNIVNSTWIQNDWDFRIGYLDHLARYYGAGVNLMDFFAKPEESRVTINTWVSDQTNNKINDLLPAGSIDQSTAMVLTNAIYFLADWKKSFDVEQTKNASFFLLDKTTQQTPVMRFVDPGKQVKMLYSRKHGARALDFPYKGDRLAMTVIMPDMDSFPSFEKSLSRERLDDLVSALREESLMVSLPKFKFTTGSISLVPALAKLGMTDAFMDGIADFSGMDGTRRLYVSSIVHKAFISVDEKGTEAAAATGVVMSATSINPDIIEFNVNRPFIFVIRDKTTGVILFMGKIVNPLLTQ